MNKNHRVISLPHLKSDSLCDVFNTATGPIWMDDMICQGTEKHLLNCAFKSWGVTDCTHKEDVGIICENNGRP